MESSSSSSHSSGSPAQIIFRASATPSGSKSYPRLSSQQPRSNSNPSVIKTTTLSPAQRTLTPKPHLHHAQSSGPPSSHPHPHPHHSTSTAHGKNNLKSNSSLQSNSKKSVGVPPKLNQPWKSPQVHQNHDSISSSSVECDNDLDFVKTRQEMDTLKNQSGVELIKGKVEKLLEFVQEMSGGEGAEGVRSLERTFAEDLAVNKRKMDKLSRRIEMLEGQEKGLRGALRQAEEELEKWKAFSNLSVLSMEDLRRLSEALKAEKKRRKDDDERKNLCVVCMERTRQIICTPCNHVCLCEACSMKMNGICPMDRKKVSFNKIFL
eukprot:TRINITY_DN19614_c2_g1_i1.p1 TRINITY_DN19614_c2_g1~~TRINITY_DN19614_c2_g1_i1.p1  ORF type:complete len:344 (-),score=89.54 TRINITY_DN19614_c2_g1_i1:171-1133(-)